LKTKHLFSFVKFCWQIQNIPIPDNTEYFVIVQRIIHPLQGHTFKIEPYQHYYNADGFIRPYLPITAIDSPGEVKLARWKLIPFWVKNEEGVENMRKSKQQRIRSNTKNKHQFPAFEK